MLTLGYKEMLDFPSIDDTTKIIDLPDKSYYCLRDGMGHTYQVKINIDFCKVIVLQDSAKLYPQTIENMGSAIGYKKLTEDFDYDTYRPYDYQPTKKEWGYMWRDIEILNKYMSDAIDTYNDVPLTRAGIAFKEMIVRRYFKSEEIDRAKIKTLFKKCKNNFLSEFPVTSLEQFEKWKPSYNGGFVWVKPEIKGLTIGEGSTADINSSYPDVLQHGVMPIGEGVEETGRYENDPEHPLFIQKVRARFRLKPDSIPTLPKELCKKNKGRGVISSDDCYNVNTYGYAELSLTNFDFAHFLKNYNVFDIVYVNYIKFASIDHPFKAFIDYVGKEKVDAKEALNMVAYLSSKLTMNGSYGKFGQSPKDTHKEAYIDEDGITRYNLVELDEMPKNFLFGAIFITAQARNTLFNGIYSVGYERFLYCDTDSIHLKGHETPKELSIDNKILGKWKIESYFKKAKYLRDKTYIEEQVLYDEYKDVEYSEVKSKYQLLYFKSPNDDNKTVKYEHLTPDKQHSVKFQIKGAGMTDAIKKQINSVEDMQFNVEYSGNLKQKQVKGGSLLCETTMTITDDKDNTDANKESNQKDFEKMIEKAESYSEFKQILIDEKKKDEVIIEI